MPNLKRPFAIVFVHGLAKKPSPDKLQELWLWGLSRDNPMPSVFAAPNAGIDLETRGIPSLFNYYADVFYGANYETTFDSYYEANEADELQREGLDQDDASLPTPVPANAEEAKFLLGFEAKLMAQLALVPAGPGVAPQVTMASGVEQYEIASWLPLAAKQAIIKKAAMEAFYYLFDKEYLRPDGIRFKVRKELRSRLLTQLAAAHKLADKVVLVTHSMGTIVAYDVLRNCADCPPVDSLITLGSPLGIREVQEPLIAEGAGDVDFPAEKLGRWVNVYDPLDPVAGADPVLSNDYRSVAGKSVEDIKESNWGSWRHTITHYFAGTKFRRALAQATGMA